MWGNGENFRQGIMMSHEERENFKWPCDIRKEKNLNEHLFCLFSKIKNDSGRCREKKVYQD